MAERVGHYCVSFSLTVAASCLMDQREERKEREESEEEGGREEREEREGGTGDRWRVMEGEMEGAMEGGKEGENKGGVISQLPGMQRGGKIHVHVYIHGVYT